MRRNVFLTCWLLSIGVLFSIPYLDDMAGRIPSGSYPLEGGAYTRTHHTYLVFPKVHHAQFSSIRHETSRISREIEKYAPTANEIIALKDSLIDYANPITVAVMPPVTASCASFVERYESHQAALKRAFASHWQPGGNQNCTEIMVTVTDQNDDQHLEYRSVRREYGRILFLNDRGGALAQILLWRDDYSKVKNSQVQPLDPLLDVGSGFSTLPLDWPRIDMHRQQIREMESLRLPYDGFLQKRLMARGLWPWSCSTQLLGLRYRDSWGRNATSQWCYGDSFPKIIENDHYYAFRVEE